MLAGAALRKTSLGWEFTSEAALEDFVWDNLPQLLELTPLKRQHPELGEYCDILAVDHTKKLTIIELKNTEDRYVVQQLTRYYDNLINAKTFSAQIDYEKPVRLIAIAPSFHRHNLIDRKYTKLIVDFLQVTVIQVNDNFHLQLQDIDTRQVWAIPIPYQELNLSTISQDIPQPPQQLLDWLGSCTGDEQQAIIKLREKILSFDARIKEEIEGKNTIRYGRSKTKPVAEICFYKKTNKPVVFLWMPTPSSSRFSQKEVIGRLRLWMNGAIVTHVGHIPEGFGKMKLESEWNAIPQGKRLRAFHSSFSYKSFTPVETLIYKNAMVGDPPEAMGFAPPMAIANHESLECLADLALAKWRSRI
jgi:RecB family endonuclease NucS